MHEKEATRVWRTKQAGEGTARRGERSLPFYAGAQFIFVRHFHVQRVKWVLYLPWTGRVAVIANISEHFQNQVKTVRPQDRQLGALFFAIDVCVCSSTSSADRNNEDAGDGT